MLGNTWRQDRPFYRDSSSGKTKKMIAKITLTNTWLLDKPEEGHKKGTMRRAQSYKGGKNSRVTTSAIFVPRTDGGILAQRLKKLESDLGGTLKNKIKEVEETGQK